MGDAPELWKTWLCGSALMTRGDDGGLVSDDPAHATPTHWAVDPLLLPSASWMRACEELYVYLDSGFAKQIIEHSRSGSWRELPGSGLPGTVTGPQPPRPSLLLYNPTLHLPSNLHYPRFPLQFRSAAHSLNIST